MNELILIVEVETKMQCISYAFYGHVRTPDNELACTLKRALAC